MDLQWPHILSLMPPCPTFSALQSGFEPWTPYRVGLFLEAPCTQLTSSLYQQGWILDPPPSWRCWRPCWWCWRPWRWSWSLGWLWRTPIWVGEALMTHSVVIHVNMKLYNLHTIMNTYIWIHTCTYDVYKFIQFNYNFTKL